MNRHKKTCLMIQRISYAVRQASRHAMWYGMEHALRDDVRDVPHGMLYGAWYIYIHHSERHDTPQTNAYARCVCFSPPYLLLYRTVSYTKYDWRIAFPSCYIDNTFFYDAFRGLSKPYRLNVLSQPRQHASPRLELSAAVDACSTTSASPHPVAVDVELETL